MNTNTVENVFDILGVNSFTINDYNTYFKFIKFLDENHISYDNEWITKNNKNVERIIKMNTIVKPKTIWDYLYPKKEKYSGRYDFKDTDVTTEVNNIEPDCYRTETGISILDIIHTLTINSSGVEAFDIGNVIKYLARYQMKYDIEDLKKAKWYLTDVINHIENLGE